MKKFLSEAAKKIINSKHFGAQAVVILPNRRSEVFLKEEIKKISDSNIWLPEFYPIDEFINKISRLEKEDNISIFFALFKIHQNIAGSEAKTIDEFLTWAPMMLSDFNDIDSSMADAKEIFTQLSAVKAIQQWNPDGSPLTKLQQNYLHFFNSLYNYYTSLRSKLISNNAGYQGLINKYVAENTSSLLNKQHWNNFLIVGLNALKESEISIFDFINQNYNSSFIWDVDEYYFSKNTEGNNQQEAGKQIRKVINRLKLSEPDNIGNNLSTSKKTINILGVPKNIGQAKLMGQELLNHFDSDKNQSKSPMQNTAIVLANEELLIPLLNSLPSSQSNSEKLYNVTLGYPLNNSQIEHFFNSWIDLIVSQSQNNGNIHTSKIISLLNNPILKQLINNNESEIIINYLTTNNIAIITADELNNKFYNNNKTKLQLILPLLYIREKDKVTTTLERFLKALILIVTNNHNFNILIKEQFQQLIKIINKLILLSTENKNIINYNTIKKIGHQLISQSTINLIGKPLVGIQIMGMLETRNLDFENIYILSVNEGTIPKTNTINSFIPMDIRSSWKLPMPSDESDIYAYHFYRLLQRAKNITLVYNSDVEKLGGGEKSRFILQIENELMKTNPLLEINNKIINTDIIQDSFKDAQSQKIIINKNEDISRKLLVIAKNGYSPSILSSYITCPLKFYFSHILKISTNSTIEQSVEANTFGTVVHAVLEEIYKQLEGQEIVGDFLKKHKKITRTLLKKQFKLNFSNSELNSGKNLLIFEVAHNYIIGLLNWDISYLKNHKAIIKNTEVKIVRCLKQNSQNINFKGHIDRIDTLVSNGTTRIIDYKTGKVESRDLTITNTENITTDPKYAKAFQVIFYAWLYHHQNPITKLETGIISLRSISKGFIPLKLKEFDNIQDYFDDFSKSLIKLVTDISDTNLPFTQTDDTSRCEWCDFKSICNR